MLFVLIRPKQIKLKKTPKQAPSSVSNYKPTDTKPVNKFPEETTEDYYTTHKTVKKQLITTETNNRPQPTGLHPRDSSKPSNRRPNDQVTLENVDRNKTTTKTSKISKESKRPISDTIPDDDLSDDSIEDTEERHTTRSTVKTEVATTKLNKINKTPEKNTERPSDSAEEDTDVCRVTEREIDRKTTTTKTNKIIKDTKQTTSNRKPTDREPEEERPSDSSKTRGFRLTKETTDLDDYNETTALVSRDSKRPTPNRTPNDNLPDDASEDYYTTNETVKKQLVTGRTTTIKKPEPSKPVEFKPSRGDTKICRVTSGDINTRTSTQISQSSKYPQSKSVKPDDDIPDDIEDTEEYYISTTTGKKQVVTTKTEKTFEPTGKRPTSKPLKTLDSYKPVHQQSHENLPDDNTENTEDYYTSNNIVKKQHITTDRRTNKRPIDSSKPGVKPSKETSITGPINRKPNKDTPHYISEDTNQCYATNEFVKQQITVSKTDKKPHQTTKRPTDRTKPVDSEDSDVCYDDSEETSTKKTETTYKYLGHPQKEVLPKYKPSDSGKIKRPVDDDDDETSYTTEDVTDQRTTTSITTKYSKPKQTDYDSPQKAKGSKYPSETTKSRGSKPIDTTEKRYVTSKPSKPNLRKPENTEESYDVSEDIEEHYGTSIHHTTSGQKFRGKTPTTKNS
ncbi:hypothetical protein FQR65_LT18945 [Abscondita terminalis]|nr:hypothetical protein FQR65_LT18945 [Abscondita terminalis]